MIQTWISTGTRMGNPAPWQTLSGMGWGSIGITRKKPANKGGNNRRYLYDMDGREWLTAAQMQDDPRNVLKLSTKAIASRLLRASKKGHQASWEMLQRDGSVRPSLTAKRKEYRLTTGETTTANDAYADARNVNNRALSTIRGRLCTGCTSPESLWG